MAREYRYISADGHFESPPEQWTHRVPEKYRDRTPRRIKRANGKDAVIWAENNIGWIPYYYEQMDRAYEANRHWAERLMGVKPLSRLPSE